MSSKDFQGSGLSASAIEVAHAAGAADFVAAAAGGLIPPSKSIAIPQVVVDYGAGAVAGMACVAVGHPWDSVKTRMQASSGPNQSAWSCLKATLQKEGVRGLYLGLSPRLLGGAAEAAVLMGVYQTALAFLTRPHTDPLARSSGVSSLQQQHRWWGPRAVPESVAVPIAGGVAGAAVSLVLGPSELIKCRMQVSTSSPSAIKYTSPMHCFRHLLATEGVMGLTRGMGATMAREVPGNVIYFWTYQKLRDLLPGKPSEAASSSSGGAQQSGVKGDLKDAASAIVCGGLAGMALWGFVMPVDVAKTRIQTAATGGRRDMGVLRTLRALYKDGGRAKLYAGMSPAVARAFPANATQWLVFELVCKYVDRWSNKVASAERDHPAAAIAAAH